jgi:dipeptidyl aminopeptidase/acylaminoacyl peptidase
LHGDKDTDVPHEQSVAMAAELKRAGVEHELISIKGGEHGFDNRGMQDANVSAAFDKIETFLKEHLGSERAANTERPGSRDKAGGGTVGGRN